MTSIVDQAHRLYDAVPEEIPLPDGSLFEVLETTARFYPDRVAIDYFGATTTYAEILDASLRGAQVLLDAGVRRGDVVAVSLPNCPQAFTVFYACQRLGAVAAQHNPLAPDAEVLGQLHRHHAKVAVVWEKCAHAFPLDGGCDLRTVMTVDISRGMPRSQRALLHLPVEQSRRARAQLRGEPPAGTASWDRALEQARTVDPATPRATGDDLAVILHTGGTNGVPKSVPLTHRNIGANVNQCLFWVWKLHEGAEVFYSLLPYFHAFGLTFCLCCAVGKAATQIVLPSFDVDMALDAHRRRPVTFFVGVPPMFERIAKRAQETGTDLSSIRLAVAGAMPLSTEFARAWEEQTGGWIVEGYGLSETSPVICGSPISPDHRHGVLGIPFPSTEVRLAALDDPARDVPDGQPGEILVRGPQVFRGYLGMPEETARVFTEDGWFRTGDIAVDRDGYLTLADRAKELILSGGFNVYPSQVENAIRSMPGVKDVAVVGVPVGDQREEVAAAVVLEDAAAPVTLAQVREWAEKSIAHYALPRQLAVIAELPHNQIGKVMRRTVKEQLLDPASRAVLEPVQRVIGQVSGGVAEAVDAASDAVRRVLPGGGPADDAAPADQDGPGAH